MSDLGSQGRDSGDAASRNAQVSEKQSESSEGQAPSQMSVTSDEVNYLIYRYAL